MPWASKNPLREDVLFEDARDVDLIPVRLAPIDIGFDLRLQWMQVELPAGDELRVSYATREDQRRVMTGSRADVTERLRQEGYRVSNPKPGQPRGSLLRGVATAALGALGVGGFVMGRRASRGRE